MKHKLGLALSGGGGKGAYQIGAWKALKEFGIDKYIDAVAGTSVGVLNTTLFLLGDYNLAEKIWLSISQDKILSIKISSILKYFSDLNIPDFNRLAARLEYLSEFGFFSRSGLKKSLKRI